MLKELCNINGTSGDEKDVREYIISAIKDYCQYSVDALGSVIAVKKGKKKPNKSLMIAAHMDEVGFIITSITSDGFLKFSSVGGIDTKVILDRVVTVNSLTGVIGTKAVHLLNEDEKSTPEKESNLVIDIGASDEKDALQYVKPGDFACFVNSYTEFGDGFIKSKALDDRIGCMLMIELIKSDLEYDTTFVFNVQEEVGLRGATCSSFQVQSDISIILESTTAADLDNVKGGNRVCVLGDGPVVSFMDGRTIYDRELFKKAFECAEKKNIKCQTKTAIAGGNDAGAIQRSGKGSRLMSISIPSRYIHCASSVVKQEDIDEARKLLKAVLEYIYD